MRCAIYTRKSTDEGLEQSFNSLDAQREACEAFIASQKHEGWVLDDTPYDDGLQYTDLTIAQGTGSNANNTIISSGSEYLAILTGIDYSDIGEVDFTPVDIA